MIVVAGQVRKVRGVSSPTEVVTEDWDALKEMKESIDQQS